MQQDFDTAVREKSLAKVMDVIEDGRNDNHLRRPAAKPGAIEAPAQRRAANGAYASQADWAEAEAEDRITLRA